MGLDELPLRGASSFGGHYCVLRSVSGKRISIVYYSEDTPHGPFKAGEWYVWTEDNERDQMLKPLDPLMAQCLIYHYLTL